MKKVELKLDKVGGMVELSPIMDDFYRTVSYGKHTYGYVAIIDKYHSSKNIDKTYLQNVDIDKNHNLLVNYDEITSKVKGNDIIEIKSSYPRSYKYSYTSHKIYLVQFVTKDRIELLEFDTVYKAVKYRDRREDTINKILG